jgi:hypothetical protein
MVVSLWIGRETDTLHNQFHVEPGLRNQFCKGRRQRERRAMVGEGRTGREGEEKGKGGGERRESILPR